MSRFLIASRRVRGAVGVVALVALVSPACGKKGPPLPPFSNVPGPPPDTTVRRKGDQVEIRFKVPVANSDGRQPARIDHVDVYAATSEQTAAAAARPAAGASSSPTTLTPPLVVKRGKLVGSVVVREPPPPPPEVKEGEPPPPPPPPRTDPGLDQGVAAIIVDTLTPADLEPTVIRELEKAKKRDQEDAAKRGKDRTPPVLTPPDYGPAIAKLPVRYYVVVGANGGDKGTPTQRLAVPVEPAPPAPSSPEITIAEGHLELAWTAPGGLRRPILLTVLPPKAAVAAAGTQQAAPAAGQPAVDGGDGATEAEEDEDDEDRESRVPPAEGGIDAPRALTLQGTPAGQPPAPPPTPAPAAPPAGTAPGTAGAPAQAEGAAPAVAGPATPATTPEGTTGVLPARLLTNLPNTIYTYAVYEVAAPNFTPAKQEEGAVPPFPVLLTPAAVAATTYRDERFEVGVERCYAVSTVATTGATSVESPMSKPACVKAVDTFAPSAPTKLEAVASEGAVSLIWEASPEADVAGYLVLRGEAGAAQLAPLFKTPIKETTYRDVSVKAGTRYVYAVVAVDTAAAHNVSPPSNRVEETAR